MILERLESRMLLVATVAAPVSVTTLEDKAIVISGISFTSTSAPVAITLKVEHGVLTLSTNVTSGLTVSGNGTASVTIGALTVAAANTAFASPSALTYTPAANFNGMDSLTIDLNNGIDVVAEKIVPITITPVVDVPTFSLTANANQVVLADTENMVLNFATNIQAGPDASGQGLMFVITTDNNALFAVMPAINSMGTLSFTPKTLPADTTDVATVSVVLQDTGNMTTSTVKTFSITASGLLNPVYNSVAGAKLRAFVVNGVLTVQANGIPFVSYPSDAIESLTFNCGSKNDEIVLSGMTEDLFPNLTTVTIKGGAGNDRIVGSFAQDSIDGGSGNDTLSGGENDDTLIGGAGTDMLVETADVDLDLTDTALVVRDSMMNALEIDRLVTIENASLTSGDGGNKFDANDFTRGAVTLIGGAGDDTLIGGSRNDAISGRDGDDELVGAGGNDTLLGGFGKDALTGDAGNDLLIGGFDDDDIDGGDGRDTAVGGQGGSSRGGDRVADEGDELVAEVVNEAFKKLFAFE